MQASVARGGGKLSLDVLEAAGFDRIDPRAPEPPEIAGRSEEVRRVLDFLGRRDRTLRALAVMRIKGYTNERIGGVLGVSTATVERKLGRVRSLLEEWYGGQK